ncbi:MAG: DUF4192 domain-containing protein [Nocardioides sp.]
MTDTSPHPETPSTGSPARSAPRTLRLKHPADLLAAVPGLLGFHPEDSVVLVTVGGAGTPFHARVDLPEGLDDVDTVADELVPVAAHAGVTRVALVLYTDDAAIARLVLETFDRRLAAHGVAIVVALRADGRHWFLLADDRGRGRPDLGVPYDLSTHPLTVEAVVEGRVVHASREALRDSLVGSDPDEIERVAAAVEVAIVRLQGVAEPPGGSGRPGPAREHLVNEGRWVQHRVRRFLAEGVRLDTHDVGRLLVAMISIDVRDVAWSEMRRDNASAHVDLWRDVVRRSPLEALAPAAALLAFAAWLTGDGALAWCAVDRCQEAEPGYGLAGLVSQALAGAVPPTAWSPFPPEHLTLFARG